jgi:hypothetical protein
MRKNASLTAAQALEAFALAGAGLSLSAIVERLGLRANQRQAVWRALRRMTTAQARVEQARRTRNYELLTCEEAVAAMASDEWRERREAIRSGEEPRCGTPSEE